MGKRSKPKPPTHQRRIGKPESAGKGSRWRFKTGAILLLALGAGLWYGLTWRSPPLPAVDLSSLDPEVVQLIAGARQEVRAAPRSGAAWGKLGTVLLHYEFKTQARFALEQAERLAPEEPLWPYLHAVLLTDEHSEVVLAKLQTAVARGQDWPDMPRVRLAQLLFERGQLDQAATHFQTLLDRQPTHPLALLGLARLRLAQGRPADSTNFLARCLNDPHVTKSAHALLAQVNLQLGRIEAADTAARQSAQLPPDRDWPDPYWSGALRYRVGRKARVDEAVALLSQERTAEAMTVLNTLTNDYPKDGEAWYLIGWIFNQERRGAEAERVLREHLRLSPDSPKGQAQLAAALLAQERYADAIPVLQRALQLKPTWSALHFNLGYAWTHLGQNEQAIGHFRNTIQHNPNHLDGHILLADLLSRRGQRDEAVGLLRQALKLDPANQRAASLLKQIAPDEE